jgi:Na+-driven multidrug efflux pump
LIGASFYQAIGKGLPALLLTLTKQLFFLTPFVLILPPFLGLEGIWWAFPIADGLSGLVCWYYLRKGVRKMRVDTQINDEVISA